MWMAPENRVQMAAYPADAVMPSFSISGKFSVHREGVKASVYQRISVAVLHRHRLYDMDCKARQAKA